MAQYSSIHSFVRHLMVLSCLVFTLMPLSTVVQAKEPIYTSLFSNLALQGYDSVSYFEGNGEPVKGKESFQTQWRGATWYFANAENLQRFVEKPESFAPAYGGYCAWALANNKLAKGDALHYTLIDNTLYLNYNQDIHDKWLVNSAQFIQQADAHYPQLVAFDKDKPEE